MSLTQECLYCGAEFVPDESESAETWEDSFCSAACQDYYYGED